MPPETARKRTMSLPKKIFRHAFFPLLFYPLIMYAEGSAAELLLNWVDNSSSESGFFIERSDQTDGSFVRIAVVSENSTSYIDSHLAPGATYCYRVQAFNEFTVSPYSNTACAVTTTVMAMLESQDHGQPVSGVTVVRGWAFDVQASNRVSNIELSIDGVPYGTIPCCAERRDVEAAFPEFPPANTRYSGWGTVLNWGVMDAGVHTLQLKIHNTAGGPPRTETRTVFVIKPGDFEYLETFDLSAAEVSLTAGELVVRKIRIRDHLTWREKRSRRAFAGPGLRNHSRWSGWRLWRTFLHCGHSSPHCCLPSRHGLTRHLACPQRRRLLALLPS